MDILASKMEDILRLCIKSESMKIKVFCHESMQKKLDMRLRVLGGLLESVYPGRAFFEAYSLRFWHEGAHEVDSRE